MEISHRYDDIIDLPHHVSEKHPHMPMLDRAAQFSPFAALTGYDAAIVETARLTDQKRELTEEQKQVISKGLHELQKRIKNDPLVTVTFFKPDDRKSGGAYRTVTGNAKKVDAYLDMLLLTDGTAIPFDSILSLE
jgi:hypothetical protein